MKRDFIIFIIGGIFFSIITSLAYSYNAKDISYTPSNNNWKVGNIKEAIDSIKNTNDTTITNLNNQITSLESDKTNLQKEITRLNSLTTHVEFKSSTVTQTFNLGFRPDYIACFSPYDGTAYPTIVYNKTFDANYVVRSNGAESGKLALSQWFTINNNGFTWNINHSSWINKSIYCFASK